MNRAATYLKQGEHDKCCLDCTHVLDHLPPAPPRMSGQEDAHQGMRLKAWVRRGSAHFNAGRILYASQDYEQAVRIQPGNQQLIADLQKMQALLKAQQEGEGK
eukprot:TRINITY_DN1068_c0_g1_i3.p1 TRINITY_DN1068_c0_g1~~TRINITY_DN1068_c0_g1_i3.p1  ORF type:complete len:103 (-),score=14.44 TRINITY_DN1068_c0_g1_i3:117-425(-)